MTFARGALRIGMCIPDIEKHLVAKGLSGEEANATVMDLIAGDVRKQMGSTSGGEGRRRFVVLTVSGLIGGACLVLAYWFGGSLSLGIALIWVVPALASIWIPELTDMGDSDWGAGSWVSGWVVLLLYLGYRVFLAVVIR
ncbi:MAG TPA: hypothetical protein VKE98_12635 [Gemmataceae bacterium]|nr:hypothetical protein [Gemmataceae bacterium]